MYSHTSEAVKYFCVLYSRCRTNAIADQKSPTVIYCGDSPAWQESRVLLMQLVFVVGKRISLVKGTRNQPKASPPWRQQCSQALHHFSHLSLNPLRFCKNCCNLRQPVLLIICVLPPPGPFAAGHISDGTALGWAVLSWVQGHQLPCIGCCLSKSCERTWSSFNVGFPG